MQTLQPPDLTDDTSVAGADAAPHNLLNSLRYAAMRCRAKPRADLFQACAKLQTSRSVSKEAHADTLIRCLQEALGHPPRLLAPGSAERTFDEAWLEQLGNTIGTGDRDSSAFLLKSRVLPEHRRHIAYLIKRVAVA